MAQTATARTAEAGHKHPKFPSSTGFHAELKARVEEYFHRQKRSPHGGPRLYLKTGVIACWAVAAYILLVFVAATWWQALLCAFALGLAIAAIGFNIQHDGNHGAFSRRPWVNRLMGLSLDAVGASSYVWFYKHNVAHHTYTNLAGADEDISLGVLGRLSPAQRRLWIHRFQHYYLWTLYTMLVIKWHFFDDFRDVFMGRVGGQKLPRPRGWDLAIFLGGKLYLLTVAFVIPMLFHRWWIVLIVYAATLMMVGLLLAVIFQLAHSVEEAAHPVLADDTANVGVEWAVHEVQTTVNFSRNNPVLTWFVGGLNYQIEHHLFPRISHVHYPAISRIVEDVSKRFGVRYRAHQSFFGALRSHFLFLRAMGRPSPV